jgi:Protein of unknown function (DUF1653)
MPQQLELGVYVHFKGGYYLVVGTSRDTETGDDVVVYKPLYGHHETDFQHRPLAMFLEDVEPGMPRFRYLGSKIVQYTDAPMPWIREPLRCINCGRSIYDPDCPDASLVITDAQALLGARVIVDAWENNQPLHLSADEKRDLVERIAQALTVTAVRVASQSSSA